MKVTLIDYGAGNVPSVERALARLGALTQRSSSPECIAKAEALLLPGVGHYAILIRALDDHALRAPLLDAINRGVPFSAFASAFKHSTKPAKKLPNYQGSISCPVPSVLFPQPSNFHTWDGTSSNSLVLLDSSKASPLVLIFISPTFSPSPTPTEKPSLAAITARISPPSLKNRMSSPFSSILKKAATQARTCSRIF